MIYTRRKFGEDLAAALDAKMTIVEIAKWAYRQYLDNMDTEPGVEEELLNLTTMEEGEGFEMSNADLRALAEMMMDRT
jgi:Golgi nucleoside diphosphatase